MAARGLIYNLSHTMPAPFKADFTDTAVHLMATPTVHAHFKSRFWLSLIVLSLALFLTACDDTSPTPTAGLNPGIRVTINGPTSTPIPTATPVPTLAGRVNDEDITLERFNAELKRYVQSQPNAPAFDSADGQQLAAQLKDTVLDMLIEQVLIAQEAAHDNVVITEKQIDQELSVTKDKAGGDSKFEAWLMSNQETEQDAREQIRLDLLTNALTAKVLVQLPRTAEYVHAYHIVVATEAEAEQIQAELNNGTNFEALASNKSIDESTRAAGGDLDWFSRGAGSVLWTEVEDAAFALQPGDISPIIKSPIGYHIIKVVARETRPLTEADTAYLQQNALRQWMDRLKAGAKIERMI